MNKHLHRIIFNAARGQRMVVAETAISHGTAGAGGSDASAKTFTARLTKIGLAVGLACGLALALLAPFVVHAQIKADTTAPGTQRPVILQTGNGVPLVNIATPSAAGVSRNVFSQFDVRPNGVILNNVRSNAAKTTIGGYVQANPFLASGAARVILNEVNSSNPTYLNGPTEVAGSRAEVVIANPSGIRVNGGTFLNASGVTLTTGTPVLSGGNLDAFLVRRGTVDISGLGLDASTADYTRILARAMEVNAGLWAQHLTVVTGTNEVKALASGADATTTQIVGTGAAPNFMLDVGAIGGMYAGHIYLVGTEAGLGVNNRGAVSAQQGKMVLLANGQLVNQGTIQAKGDVTVSAAGAIDNSGASAVISSQGHLDVTSGSTVSNTGGATVAATGSLSVAAAGSLSNVGTITPANTVVASTIAAHGAVRIRALGIDNTLGTVASVHSTLTLDSQGQSLVNSGATMSSAQAATMDSGALNNDQGLIQTGGALSINTGRQTLSDLLVRGSDVTAGHNATLQAEGNIDLQAAQNTASLTGSNSSSSGSLGVSMGLGAGGAGMGFTASASKGRGNESGSDTTHTNTHVTAGNTATLKSDGDTTFKGAIVKADTVEADVGGNLSIQSLQDASTYDSQQKNIGASVTVGAGTVSGGSFNAGKSNIDSDYRSVTETSGIKAGDGGFDVSVGGNTDLSGSVIASNQSAVDQGRNSFDTGGTLTSTDLQNTANYSASSTSVRVGVGQVGKDLGISGVGMGVGRDSGSASSTTTAGISGIAGDAAVRSTDAETGIARIFEKERVQAEIDAQAKITETFGREASKFVGDYAEIQTRQAIALREQARTETDPDKRDALNAQADQLQAEWGDNGWKRIAAHTVIGGLTGGASGALGAATGTLSAPLIAQALKDAGIDGPLASTLTGLGSTLIGAAAGGTPGGAAALNEVANNYLNHQQWNDLSTRLKACKTSAECERVTKEFVALSAKQDAEMRQACVDTDSSACRSHISAALVGSQTQMDLVIAGSLPANYAAGADLNAQANRWARHVIVSDIRAACLADAACRQRQDDVNGIALLGTIGLIGGAPALSSLGSAAVAWIVANPVTATALGIISAETAAALASGAITPGSLAEGMLAMAASGSIKFVGNASAGRNLIGGTTIKTLADLADSATAQSAAQAQRLQQELSALSKVQPDTARDAWYLANTDQSLLTANKFDMNHVLSGEINAAGRATGYHAELAAEGSARIRPGSPVTQNANGTYTAQVDVFDSTKGVWVEKTSNKGQSTFFDPSWSQARIEYEVAEAFRAGLAANPGATRFTWTTRSNVQIQFTWDGTRTTFYPTGN